MKNKIILGVLSGLLFFCADPGLPLKKPFQIFSVNRFNPGTTESLNALNDVIQKAEKSIECTLSDFDTGPGLELKSSQSGLQKSVMEIAQNIVDKHKAGLEISLIFDADKKCISSGSLFFQYPDIYRDNAYSEILYKDIINDCLSLPSRISVDLKTDLTNNRLHENEELFYTNTSGSVSDNFCIIDHHMLWFSLTPLTDTQQEKLSLTFLLDVPKNPVIDKFQEEFDRLKNGLTGAFKKPANNVIDFNVYDSTWRVLWGPQDKPLTHLAGLIDSADTIYLYSTGLEYDTKNPIMNSIINGINPGKNFNFIFSDTGVFSANSFIQNYFFNQGYCQNQPDFCKDKVKYLNRKADQEKSHLLLIKDKKGIKKSIFLNGPMNSTEAKYDDTTLVEITSDAVYDLLFKIWNSYSQEAVTILPSAKLPDPQDITITEIVWMGSVDNLKNSHTSDEAIEFYNATNHDIDLSGVTVACTASLVGNTATDVFSLPQGIVIGPHQYFAIHSKPDGAFSSANLTVPDLTIGNTTRQCLLIDNRKPVSAYYPTGSVNGHYNDSRLKGIILDQVLDYTQNAWNSDASQFFSKTGLNTIKYGIEGEGVRSMEKYSPDSDGKLLKNWHMNTFTPRYNHAAANYIYHTFTSIGYENSPPPNSGDGSIIISEIHWMGSYDQFAVSNASDEFVELYNISAAAKNIGGWTFGCSTDIAGAVGKPLFAIPYGTVIQPGKYLTIQKTGASAFLYIDYTLDFTLNNTITQCLLTDSSPAQPTFEGSDANGDGILSGHYDNPLFVGAVIDAVSDRRASLASLGLGMNNTALKIRRSCERVNTQTSGYNPANWRTNTTLPAINTGVQDAYKFNTFATPGTMNSF